MSTGFSKTTRRVLVGLTWSLVTITCMSLVAALLLLVFFNNPVGYLLVVIAIGSDAILFAVGRWLRRTILKKLFLR